MLETYIIYAIVGLFALFVLWLVFRYAKKRLRILSCRSLLPYSDIQKDVEKMEVYFGRDRVERFILDYFKEGDNFKRAKEMCEAARDKN